MTNKLVTLFFLLSLSLSAQLPDEHKIEEVSEFLILLKSFEYESSLKLVEQFDYDIQKEARVLVHVLYQAEQFEFDVILKRDLKNPLAIALNKLSYAYNSLFKRPNEANSFKVFNEVYIWAKEIGFVELQKFSLISILEVYNFELFQTNEEGLKYLEAFSKLTSSLEDEYHYRMNLLQFSLRDIFFNVEVDDIFFEEFDFLMRNFSAKHKFWPNYYSSKGVYLETQKQYDLAEKNYIRAIGEINDENYLRYLKFRSYIRIAEIKKKMGLPKQAIQFIDSAAVYKDQVDSVRSNYYLHYYYSGAFAMMENYKLAYKNIRISDSLKVYIDYEKNANEISSLNIKYRTAEKEKKILEAQQKARTNKNWLIAAVLALFFSSGIAILLQKNTSKKRQLIEKEALLKQQRLENLLKEQELMSIDAMITGQEKERTKVANELHDDLGSLMATVKLHFDNVKVDQKDPAMKNAQDLLDRAYQKIRGMAHAKNSGVMSNQGLVPAVKSMADTISRTNLLEIAVDDYGMGDRMENSLELTIFRIIQELITNIIKHSKASSATIQFTQHENNLNIIVEDNGLGFDSSAIKRTSSGMGLGTIEKRIEYLEGSFTIDSVLGKGTSILIDIPV
jgi:signal transduction histidine kinase